MTMFASTAISNQMNVLIALCNIKVDMLHESIQPRTRAHSNKRTPNHILPVQTLARTTKWKRSTFYKIYIRIMLMILSTFG